MIASAFDEENGVLSKPPEMGDMECEPLSVWRGKTSDAGAPVVISCWKFTAEEFEEVKRTGRIWLVVLGESMQPAYLTGRNPFNKAQGNDTERT